MNRIIQKLYKNGIIPVVVIDNLDKSIPLVRALHEGGIDCVEVTFRTPQAAPAIQIMKEYYPDMLIGAGTVLTIEQVNQATKAGADFIVAPGLNEKVVDYAHKQNVFIIPGVCTPTEIEHAMELNLEFLKFFPAEASGGIKYIKALCGPYTNISFMPTGGINPSNVQDYLSFNKIFACGGTWIASKNLLDENKYEEINNNAILATKIIKELKR